MFHQLRRFRRTHGKSHLGSGAPTWHHCTGEVREQGAGNKADRDLSDPCCLPHLLVTICLGLMLHTNPPTTARTQKRRGSALGGQVVMGRKREAEDAENKPRGCSSEVRLSTPGGYRVHSKRLKEPKIHRKSAESRDTWPKLNYWLVQQTSYESLSCVPGL